MSNPSKNKGKAFEREAAKLLSETFNLPFQRVPNSGAFVGGANIGRVEQISEEQKLLVDGDIIVPKELKNFSIECKFYKEFSWNKLFANKGECHLNSWIKQAEATTKPYWLLIFKINRQGSFVCFPWEYEIFHPLETTYISCNINGQSYIIADLQSFLNEYKRVILDVGSL